MLDLHYVRDNFDAVRERLSTRNFDPTLLDDFTNLDGKRRAFIRERDELNAATNRVSKEVGGLMREGREYKGILSGRLVRLAPDVSEAFTTPEAVNDALRRVMREMQQAA